MEKNVFTRKELYDLVWSESLLSLSKKYNISDVGLRKICIKASIPLPQNGHWQKVKFGRKVVKPLLSSDYSGSQEITLTIRSEINQKIPGALSPLTIQRNEVENNIQSKLIVPEKLKNPDSLVIAAKNALISGRTDSYLYIGTVSCSRSDLDTRVAKTNIPRALRFWDTLIKALRARGHDVLIKNNETNAIVEGEEFKIIFREKMKKVLVKDTHYDRTVYHPTGILSFQLYGSFGREWKDGKVSLESQLSKIIAKLELAGKEWKERRIQWKVDEEVRIEKERIRKEFEKRKEKDLSNFKETLQKATRWHKAINLRNYIDAIETRAHQNNTITEEFNAWLQWARKKADWYDPFTEADDELLNNVNKDTLTIIQSPYFPTWK